MANPLRYLIDTDTLDAAVEKILLTTTGRARKVIQSMIATTPGMAGVGGGDTLIVSEIVAQPDGTYKVYGGNGGRGNVFAIKQLSDGTWPTLTRVDGIAYEWWAIHNPNIPPTRAAGALPRDRYVGLEGSFLPDALT